MSNVTTWDEFIYFGEDNKPIDRKKYLDFCLNCGDEYLIDGSRYKLREVQAPALLLEKTNNGVCKFCNFPVFTSCNYKLLTKRTALPRY